MQTPTLPPLSPAEITVRVAQIEAQDDYSRRSQAMALLVARLFRERGYELVVVGGSAVEFFTAGDYTSGDLDFCFQGQPRPARVIAEVMASLGARALGVRAFQVAGLHLDMLGQEENSADLVPYPRLREPASGEEVLYAKAEDLLAERVLIAFYPQANPEGRATAKKLLAAFLSGRAEIDWGEARRVAALPNYAMTRELEELTAEVRQELGLASGQKENLR